MMLHSISARMFVALGALAGSSGLVVAVAFGAVKEPSAPRPVAHLLLADSAECAAPDSMLIQDVDTMVTGTDSLYGINGRLMSKLPMIPTESVTVILDSTICHRARIAAGMAATVPDSNMVASVSVLKVGATRYVVSPIGTVGQVGEWHTHLTFDSTFSLPPLAAWAW